MMVDSSGGVWLTQPAVWLAVVVAALLALTWAHAAGLAADGRAAADERLGHRNLGAYRHARSALGGSAATLLAAALRESADSGPTRTGRAAAKAQRRQVAGRRTAERRLSGRPGTLLVLASGGARSDGARAQARRLAA